MFRYTQPLLASDFQPMIVRAHRERSAVVAELIASVSRWMSAVALAKV